VAKSERPLAGRLSSVASQRGIICFCLQRRGRHAGYPIDTRLVSIIIPTFNGAARIGNCLDALLKQTARRNAEILVINDGSTDNTVEVVETYSGVRLITQVNAGPAAARNRGAVEAQGTIILFTDDDCVPMLDWLDAMLQPFDDPEIAGAKGVYRTLQKSLVARFVQIDYEDRYRLMAAHDSIDFVDTYSAAFRRERFLEMTGYDTSFPVACAEDIELSYRMSARGWKMKFVPNAIVYHTHPDTLSKYLKKKYKFAFWRMLAVRKNPGKGLKDSHTPQLMKLQVLFAPALLLAAAIDLSIRPSVPVSVIVLATFVVSTLPYALRAIRKDPVVGLLSPGLLAARACAQILGVAAGLFYAQRKLAEVSTKSHA
jgi:cellulose synthase/poly-beta-1,6-N-acetylglucosamine synthase-like glycosyltransferase